MQVQQIPWRWIIRERRQQPDSLSSPAKGRALTAQTPSDGDRVCRNVAGAGGDLTVCVQWWSWQSPHVLSLLPHPCAERISLLGKTCGPLQRDRGDCCDQVLLTLRKAVFHSSICSSLPPRPRGQRQAPLLLVPKYDLAIFITHPQLTGNCPIWELDLEENKTVLKI